MDAERPPRDSSDSEPAKLAERPSPPSPDGTIGALVEATGRALAPAARLGWRGARGVARRGQRVGRPIYAGGVTRALAIGLDAAILNGALILLSAAIALVASALTSGDQNASTTVVAFGAFAWLASSAAYLTFFWTFAERTPGMTFMGLRVLAADGERLEPRQALRRLIGFYLAALPALLGFAGILVEGRRRGWHDRLGHTVVLYADPELDRDRTA